MIESVTQFLIFLEFFTIDYKIPGPRDTHDSGLLNDVV